MTSCLCCDKCGYELVSEDNHINQQMLRVHCMRIILKGTLSWKRDNMAFTPVRGKLNEKKKWYYWVYCLYIIIFKGTKSWIRDKYGIYSSSLNGKKKWENQITSRKKHKLVMLLDLYFHNIVSLTNYRFPFISLWYEPL